MIVFINEEECSFPDGTSLLTIAETVLNQQTKGTAIALNEIVIPKSEWETTFPKHHDAILIIKATQGG
ncbi:sulfur carrier protein ThiS [Bergeyella zoohelcum]|uniref:Sulfur carrier protein ThiS n=1 Tax=Bergeyella zoohelcum TaxID=1015 RepID=A0A380ZV62_9FLAO|nr:sulfur carrier protein ThiS [Bergeyella zoohelcum]EKB60206.1 thiamine biosynthesis protein ThiS [Bergeyella zoohelcum CCUG 30536]SUV52895.1 sulfur carrier protein ThiS [Bergeyella zoohelcum]